MLRVNKRVKGSVCLSLHFFSFLSPFAIYFILIFLSTADGAASINSTIGIETFTCGGGFWYTICYFYVISLLSFHSVVGCSVFNFFPFSRVLFANWARRDLSRGMLFCLLVKCLNTELFAFQSTLFMT